MHLKKLKGDEVYTEGDDLTWKNPGGMGPPGMPSPGGMFPRTGLGAAAALCGHKEKGHVRWGGGNTCTS